MDTSLNIIYEKLLPMPAGLLAFRYNVIQDFNSNFVIAGSTDIYATSGPGLNVFLYKVSTTGDSINSYFIDSFTANQRLCHDLVEKDNKYYTFVNFFVNNSFGNILVFDSTFNILDSIIIQDYLWENYSPKNINDSLFVICTRMLDSSYIYISEINENGHIFKSKRLGKNNVLSWPSYQNSLAVSNNRIYFLSSSSFSFSNPIYGSGSSSSLIVGKLDLDLDTIWLKFIGGDYYYHPYNIKATSDGGCILVSTFIDTINIKYKSIPLL